MQKRKLILSDPVHLNTCDGCATLTLSRPDRRNALTKEMLLALKVHLDALVQRDDIRVICLTGAGQAFSAGQDLNERDPRVHKVPFDLEAIQAELYHPIVTLLRDTPKMTVAKVNGVAAGAAIGLALACDIVIAADKAPFAFAFSKVGLGSDAGVAWHLVQALGPARAKALLLQGKTLAGDEAAQLGLIADSVPLEHLDAATAEICDHLVKGPQTAQIAIKQCISAAQSTQQFGDYLKAEAKHQGDAGRDQDYANAVLAFLEKRPVSFR